MKKVLIVPDFVLDSEDLTRDNLSITVDNDYVVFDAVVDNCGNSFKIKKGEFVEVLKNE